MSAIQKTIRSISNAIHPAQKFLFDDLGDLTPIHRRRKLPPLTYKQRLKRKIARERYKKMQGWLLGPQKRRKRKSRVIFSYFPDCDEAEVPDDIRELGQLIIRERAAMVRETWSPNKQRKSNHFYVKPLVFQPLEDSHLHLESRDYSE